MWLSTLKKKGLKGVAIKGIQTILLLAICHTVGVTHVEKGWMQPEACFAEN